MIFAPQCCPQIKAKSVDAHALDPKTQAVHHEPKHIWMRHVQRIAGAGIVDVEARIIVPQPVI